MRAMDRKLRKILTDSIRDIETGARDVEGCLQRHPDRAAELRPHLELWSGLNASARAQPNFGSQQRGKQQMLAALTDMERGTDKGQMIPAVARVAVVMVAAALLVGGAAGASAAFGGPDIKDGVLNTLGIQTADDTLEAVEENAPDAALDGLETAQGAADGGLTTAGEHAAEGLSTAAGASDAAGASADGAGSSDDAPNASGSVPEDAQVPDSVPVEHTPSRNRFFCLARGAHALRGRPFLLQLTPCQHHARHP